MKKIVLSLFCLVISSTLFSQNTRSWGTYLGGSPTDESFGIAHDDSGYIYMAGLTGSNAGVASGGFQNTYGGGTSDAFLAKFDSSGNRIWATFIGASGDDQGYGVAVDDSGFVYITGFTGSTDSIAFVGYQNTNAGGTYDAFLVKFDRNGARMWGTYIGGTGSDRAYGVDVDDSLNVYITGYTSSSAGIATVGAFQTVYGNANDAFLVKFNKNGVRQWGTYFGGNGDDQGRCISVNDSGHVYIAGYAASTSAIASGGSQNLYGGGGYDAFLARFDRNGNRIWSTYLGGTQADEGRSIIATDGHVYLCGRTPSTSGIATLGAYQTTYGGAQYDAFVVKYDSLGGKIWGTYYGGSGQDAGYAITSDQRENLYFGGRTSSNTAIASGGFQSAFGGSVDAFVAKFDSSGSRICGTYLGGNGNDYTFGLSVAKGKLYACGYTQSGSGIATTGAFQTTFGGGGNDDGYLIKYSSCLDISFTSANETCTGTADGSATAIVKGGTLLPFTYLWTPGGQTVAARTNLSAGTYYINITDAYGNTALDSVVITAGAGITGTTSTINATCGLSDGSATVTPTTGASPYTYLWSPLGGTNATTTPVAAGVYSVTVTDFNGCSSVITAIVNNNTTLTVNLTAHTDVTCHGDGDGSATMLASGGVPTYSYLWSPSGGTAASANNLGGGLFSLAVTDNAGCTVNQTVTIIDPPTLVSSIGGTISICSGTSGGLSITGFGGTSPYTYLWSPSTSLSDDTASAPVAAPPTTTTYTVDVTDAHGCTTAAFRVMNVVPNPTASVSGNTGVCSGQAITLTAAGGANFNWSTGETTAAISVSPLVTTVYSVTVSNGSCTGNTTFTVTAYSSPVANVIKTDASCANCPNGSGAVFGSGTAPLSYLWMPGGMTTQIVNGLLPGVYSVCITDGNFCQTCINDTIGVDPLLFVQLVMTSEKIFLSPNPFKESCTLLISDADLFHYDVLIYDVLGKQMDSDISRNSDSFVIRKNGLNQGIYFLRILKEGNLSDTRKLVVE